MSKPAGKKRKLHQVKVHPAVMAVVLLLELFLIGLAMRPTFYAQRGFLVKVGQNYVLGWRDADGEMQTMGYNALAPAVQFAREKLALLPGRNLLLDDSVEHMWLKSGVEGHMLYWKTMNGPILNRMTFANLDEARFFERVFKMGAYSPSPIGHSVNLVPILRR